MVRKSIHIGFGDSAAGCIREAIENFGLEGDEVIPSRDDFTQGPISNCLIEGGLSQRVEYWNQVYGVLEVEMDVPRFYNQSMSLLNNLATQEVTIWPGDSCHDILATGWLLAYLHEKNMDWYIVDLSKVHKEDYCGKEPAVNLAMYTPSKLPDLWKYRSKLSRDLKEYYKDIWNSASKENSPYRISLNGSIKSFDADYFDVYILSHLANDFQETRQIIGNILREGSQRISDTTIEMNIRKLIDAKQIEFKGDLSSMHTYSIRRL